METGSNSRQKDDVKKKPKIFRCNAKELLKIKQQKKQQQQQEEEEEKQQQQQQQKNRDRISNLPDTILHHIFSFLDIELAVKTCILSKRWRYLWTTLPHLNFFNEVHLHEKDTQQLDFVDRVFVLRDTTSNIQSLHFHICSSSQVPPSLNIIKGHLTTWIFAAVKSSVQHLSVQILLDHRCDYYSPKKTNRKTSITKKENPHLFKFPDCLFTSKSLMSLMLKTDPRQHFKTCFPAANSIMSLPLLKTLHLASSILEGNDFITKLFSSCPVLESLIIKDCEFHCCSTGINISSVKLKHLVIQKCSMISNSAAADHQPVEMEFKLNSPNLISFSFTDCMSKNYTLENLSSLLKANIDMDVKVEEAGGGGGGVHRNNTSTTQLELPGERKRLYAQRMVKFLKALQNVKDLTLSPWFIEVISGTADIRFAWFWNLRCLELKTWFSRDCIHSIAYLLDVCYNIETLLIEVTRKTPTESMRWDQTNLESLNTGDYWEPRVSMECRLGKLKVVKFRGYLGCNELKFLQFLLENARVLEKLTIGFSYNGYIPDQKKRVVTKFAEMLHAYPRASSRLTIMFL